MNTRSLATSSPTPGARRKAFHVALWLVQAGLAVMFVGMGVSKSTIPIAELAQKFVWPGEVPAALVRFIGVSEILGGLGLVLPGLTKRKPGLTPWAALGLVTVMLLAGIFHATRGELRALPVNAAFGALAALVWWGRTRKVPLGR